MNVLLLGGTGAMGSILVSMLSENPSVDVYVTTRQKYNDNNNGIVYIEGNAHKDAFLQNVLEQREYECIVDFMVYSTNEFKNRINYILSKTNQYIFISSSRVYSESKDAIVESSARLLDTCKDVFFLNTDEYALSKAREENALISSKYNNWIIIRPYITYNKNRLQLCIFEKEQWLYRALKGKKVVLGKDILNKTTSMTYAYDVAFGICKLIGNLDANKEIYHIVNDNSCKWDDILSIYQKCFLKYTGKEIKLMYVDDSSIFSWKDGDAYAICYDRLYNRIFDSTKIKSIIGNFDFVSVENGIEKCFCEFLSQKELNINLRINWALEGYLDKISGELEKSNNFPSKKDKLIYYCYRYLPLTFANKLHKICRR